MNFTSKRCITFPASPPLFDPRPLISHCPPSLIPAQRTMASQATQAVNFITGNKNKLGEVKAILEPAIEVNSRALDLIEVQGTLEQVTIAKCRAAAEQVKCTL